MKRSSCLLAQETLTRHGHGAQRERRGRGRPLLLSGLLWCGRHDVRVRMGSHASQTQHRYQCDESYDAGRTDHYCTLVEARALDEPITDVVLRRCGFAEQADAVLAQIQAEYDTAREDARRRQRELAHLQHEVETLQANLAQTRAPAHVAMIFEQIDRRMERIGELADAGQRPVGRVLSTVQVDAVKAFLANLRLGWEKQPLELHNELFRLILDRVVVETHPSHVIATIAWRSAAQHRLWIERPRRGRAARVGWSAEENIWLRQQYATATHDDFKARFPHRTYMAIRKQAEVLGLKRSQTGVPKPQGAPFIEDTLEVVPADCHSMME
jgi:DASH complex subunit Hsk3 like